jgi:hypothetical protein
METTNRSDNRPNLHDLPKVTKQIFYLKIDPLESLKEEESLVCWLYRWCGRVIVTPSLQELIERYYFLN